MDWAGKCREIETIKKVWGYEIIIANNDLYCGKILCLFPRYRCSIHYHKEKVETFYILSGLVLMEVEGQEFIMRPQSIIDLPPGTKHRFTGLQSSEIVEFSTKDFPEDSYRDTKSEKISEKEWQEILDKLWLNKYKEVGKNERNSR